jgi:hypothetical protein
MNLVRDSAYAAPADLPVMSVTGVEAHVAIFEAEGNVVNKSILLSARALIGRIREMLGYPRAELRCPWW